MAKNYTIDQSATTGFWYWQCKDGSSEGYAGTKSEAKAAAQSACSAGYVITPPKVDATVISGYLATFSAKDLNNQTLLVSEKFLKTLFVVFLDLTALKIRNQVMS